MYILHFTDDDVSFREYVVLTDRPLTPEEAQDEYGGSGFKLRQMYDVETMTDFSQLPTERALVPER